MKRGRALAAESVRLSEHFLLSDFMGCHSVYAKGYANAFDASAEDAAEKLAEGEYLCATLLEPLLGLYGPMSISYGYISPELSKRIVKYQDPTKPSYHRWDKGAAVDVCLHHPLRTHSPVAVAHAIDESLPYSRMITYSESPYLCLATQKAEGGNPRRAFYENRYTGKRGGKPLFIKKPATLAARQKHAEAISLEQDWRGAGYPTYHGGGIRQTQHIRVSRYSMASDFLPNPRVATGVVLRPFWGLHGDAFKAAASTRDAILQELDIGFLSIFRGFEGAAAEDDLYSWEGGQFAFSCKPPESVSIDRLERAARSCRYVHTVASVPGGGLQIVGEYRDGA